MSKTKDYIDRMKDAGIDVLAVDDVESKCYEKIYLEDINILFVEKKKEIKFDKKDENKINK